MYKVRLNNRIVEVPDGTILADILIKSGEKLPHLCGGKGTCRKCLVLVNGKEELSCQYEIKSDIDVVLPENDDIFSEIGANESGEITKNCCYCLDIGTTTLALALVSVDKKKIIKVKTATNPQRAFGGDVLNRIEYCDKNGISELQICLINKINEMIDNIGVSTANTMYVSGNTTMLHIFFGVDPSSIGVAPYTPVFVDSKEIKGAQIGLKKIENVISLPCISTFIGADLVAGINYANMPSYNKFNLLVDLGTNAEIILYNKNELYCTSAAAGPCFEGANISCGMSATDGAICSFELNYGHISYKTVGDAEPRGICGTGLIDIVHELLKNSVIDETGYMDGDFEICKGVFLSRDDVRQYQLAKSAIYSAILTLMKALGVGFDDISRAYVSGGFSAMININSAVGTGLLPKELKHKTVALNNSSLQGTVKFSCEGADV